MAKLKTSEKRLLGIFVVGLFIVVNFFAYQEYDTKYSGLNLSESKLKLQKAKYELMLGDRETWIDRRDWVVRRLPQYRTIDDRDTHLVTLVRNAVSSAGLEIVAGPNPLPTKESEHFEETLVDVTVDGEIEPLVRFLHSLQDPEQFRTLTSLQMLPAKKESSEIRCELTLAQWWALEGPAVAVGTEPEQPPGVAEPPATEGAEGPSSTELEVPDAGEDGAGGQSNTGKDEQYRAKFVSTVGGVNFVRNEKSLR